MITLVVRPIHFIIKLGRNSVIPGIYVINIKTIRSGIKNGRTALHISLNDIFAMSETMNNPNPTGGVKSPINKLSTITTPKWIGSILNLIRIGMTIGAIIIRRGVGSKMQPAIKRKIFKINNTTHVWDVIFNNQSHVNWGRFSTVKIQDNIAALQNIQRIVAVLIADILRILKDSFKGRAL